MARIIYTLHAERMLAEREVERSWVQRTVENPEFTEPDTVYSEAVRAFRSIPENGGRVLRVVYVRDGEDMRIITTFFDRSRRK